MKFTIEVTEDDIAEGLRGSCHLCPISRALRRTFSVNCVSVSMGWVVIWDGQGPKHFAKTPASVRFFIASFDADGSGIEPFSFDLEVPTWIET